MISNILKIQSLSKMLSFVHLNPVVINRAWVAICTDLKFTTSLLH